MHLYSERMQYISIFFLILTTHVCVFGYMCVCVCVCVCVCAYIGVECLQCSTLVGLEKMQQLLSSVPDVLNRFLRFSLSDYVLSHSRLRWCPGPDCSIIFSVHSPEPKKVSCSKCSSFCW